MKADLGWHFPSSGGGEEDGVNDSGLETFEGDHAYYLAREVIQNSIDARRAECKFVEVHFKLTQMNLKDFPGWPKFRPILKACLDEVKKEAEGKIPEKGSAAKPTEKPKGEVLYEEALALPSNIPVLIASDFNTTGLCGGEADKGGQWYKCIRKKGSNLPSGEGGGTFGIGKHAPFPASKLRTVFYSTINDRNEPAFTGKAILSSFELDGDTRRGTGYFGSLEDRRAAGVRDLGRIPEAFRRKEQGLSLFIMGFREEGDWKESLMKAVLENFFVAIDRGLLKVVFETDAGKETIEQETLEALMLKYAPESAQFLVALRRPLGGKPVTAAVAHIGEVELYLAHGKEFDRKVVFMRRPLIVVQKKKRNLVHEPFAGVFICQNPDGNRVLGKLEPPTHDEWDAKRDPVNGQNILIRLTEWLNSELRKLNVDSGGEREDIAALADYLAEDEDLPGERSSGQTGTTEPVPNSGAERGAEKPDEVVLPVNTRRKPHVGRSGGGGGKLTRKKRGNRPAKRKRGGGDGKGGPRRVDLNLGIRWIPESASGTKATLILRPEEPFQGSLRLVAVSEDSDFGIAVRTAKDESGNPLKVRDGGISEISLAPGEVKRITVNLEEKAWEAIAVEAYDN